MKQMPSYFQHCDDRQNRPLIIIGRPLLVCGCFLDFSFYIFQYFASKILKYIKAKNLFSIGALKVAE